jgi:hypothetical protein
MSKVARALSVRLLPLAAALALLMAAAPGCATVAAYLPTVIAAVTDGALVVDTIERFADRYFRSRPDAEFQKKVDVAIARTRSALDLILRTAGAADAHNQGDREKALAEFREAYTHLVALLGPIGLMTAPPGGALMAMPGDRLMVPEPMALTLRVSS